MAVVQARTLNGKSTFLDVLLAKRKRVVLAASRRKLTTIIVAIVIALATVGYLMQKSAASQKSTFKSETLQVKKAFEFPALNNLGKPINTTKVDFTITTAEKTDHVMVKDQVVKAVNNKLFLIVNIDLKNDSTVPVNIVPGDLVRLTYGADENNKYAPDLSNQAVSVAAISTRPDRLGFVIPESVREFKLLVGELEKKKDTVELKFGS